MAFLLRQHRARQAEEKLRAGQAYHDHGFVFCNELGAPLVHVTVARRFKALCRRGGLNTNLTLYSLRHSAATGLLRKGESLKTISQAFGHVDIRITANTYVHVTEDLLDGAASAMATAMFGSTTVSVIHKQS